jgi:hypothetical protein
MGILRPVYAGLDDGKFVRADSCNSICPTGTSTKPLSGNPQQFVSDRMTEGFIYGLKAVEIDAQEGKVAPSTD